MVKAKRIKSKVKLWELISRAVDEGLQYGLNRAYKYSDLPSRSDLAESVEREVMNALSEVIDFDGD